MAARSELYRHIGATDRILEILDRDSFYRRWLSKTCPTRSWDLRLWLDRQFELDSGTGAARR